MKIHQMPESFSFSRTLTPMIPLVGMPVSLLLLPCFLFGKSERLYGHRYRDCQRIFIMRESHFGKLTIQLPFVLKPSMLAAVDVEQHPRNRPTRPTPPVRAALPSCGDQTRRLQRLLHPRVAIVDAVLFAQFFMKMPHVEIRVPVAIQTQHSLQLFHRNTLRTRTVMPVVV